MNPGPTFWNNVLCFRDVSGHITRDVFCTIIRGDKSDLRISERSERTWSAMLPSSVHKTRQINPNKSLPLIQNRSALIRIKFLSQEYVSFVHILSCSYIQCELRRCVFFVFFFFRSWWLLTAFPGLLVSGTRLDEISGESRRRTDQHSWQHELSQPWSLLLIGPARALCNAAACFTYEREKEKTKQLPNFNKRSLPSWTASQLS